MLQVGEKGNNVVRTSRASDGPDGVKEGHVSNHLSSHHHPHRTCENMCLRQRFSRFRNKAKEKLSPIFKKRRGVDVGGEEFDNPTLSLQSEPGIAVEGEFRGRGIKISTGKDNPRPDNPLPVSRSAVGIGHDQGGSDDSGGETSQRYLHLRPHVQTGSGSGREREDANGKGTGQSDLPLQSDIGNVVTPVISTLRSGGTGST